MAWSDAARRAAAEARRRKSPLHRSLVSNAMFTRSDYGYLRRKGYSQRQVSAFWKRDLAQGKTPIQHKAKFDIVGYLKPRGTARDINTRRTELYSQFGISRKRK